MFRRIKNMLMLICLFALLAGCGSAQTAAPADPTAKPTEVTAPPQMPAATAAPTEAPTEAPTVPPTETPTELPAATDSPTEPSTEVPYLQKVTFPDQSIFSGPSYDMGFAGTVRKAGTYTIVEESRDGEGNLWGKLKSGAGWIDLTEVRRRLETPEPLSANYAGSQLLESGDFIRIPSEPDDYSVPVAFWAHEELTDVTLYSTVLGEKLELGEELFFLSSMDPATPLVAELSFPGDMSAYAICFTDSNGNSLCYCVSISGRNGTLVMSEYMP